MRLSHDPLGTRNGPETERCTVVLALPSTRSPFQVAEARRSMLGLRTSGPRPPDGQPSGAGQAASPVAGVPDIGWCGNAPPSGSLNDHSMGLLRAHRTMENTAGKVAMTETLDALAPGRGSEDAGLN